MDIGHFQFLSGLLEICIALNLGFAIAPGFRSLPRRRFDRLYENWKELQSKEATTDETSTDAITSRLLNGAKDVIDKSVTLETAFVRATLIAGVLVTLLLMFVAAIPLIGSFEKISDQTVYFVTFVLAGISLLVVATSYIWLAIFWYFKLGHLKAGCNFGLNKELDDLFPN